MLATFAFFLCLVQSSIFPFPLCVHGGSLLGSRISRFNSGIRKKKQCVTCIGIQWASHVAAYGWFPCLPFLRKFVGVGAILELWVVALWCNTQRIASQVGRETVNLTYMYTPMLCKWIPMSCLYLLPSSFYVSRFLCLYSWSFLGWRVIGTLESDRKNNVLCVLKFDASHVAAC